MKDLTLVSSYFYAEDMPGFTKKTFVMPKATKKYNDSKTKVFKDKLYTEIWSLVTYGGNRK